MKTTVLIPAYNEAKNISRTLARLPRDLVEPIVVLNGCTDNTQAVAEQYGAQCDVYDERGKLPALQGTLKKLGVAALEPILLLDGDTRPIFPHSWHDIMLRTLHSEDRPMYVGGPVIFTPRPAGVIGENLILSVFRAIDGRHRDAKDVEQGSAAYYGPNQAMKIDDRHTLERVLALPHYWPKEDVAMAKEIVGYGHGTMRQILGVRAAALSQVSAAMPPLHHWITKDIDQIDAEITARYRESAPAGSIEFN